MVKASASLTGAKGKTAISALRIDMKRKLPLPLPPAFVVSRGYTPDYPWLGQDHAAPKPKPRLLMQQSCPRAAKVAACVLCAVLGVALILYAGSAMLSRAHGLEQWRAAAVHPQPQPQPQPRHEALVRQVPVGEDVDGALVSDNDDLYDSLVDLHLPADAGAVPSDVDGPVEEADSLAQAGPGAVQATKQILLTMRMANMAGTLQEMQERVAETNALREAYERLTAAGDSESEQPSAASQQEGLLHQEGAVAEADRLAEAGPGAVQAAKQFLLLKRMANMVDTLREMQERVRVQDALRAAFEKLTEPEVVENASDEGVVVSGLGQSSGPAPSMQENDGEAQQADLQEDLQQHEDAVGEDARLLVQWMQQAEPTDQEKQEGPQPGTADEDAQLLANWMKQAEQEQQEPQQEPQQDTVGEDARLLVRWMQRAESTDQEKQEGPQPDTADEDAQLLANWMRQAVEQGNQQDSQQDQEKASPEDSQHPADAEAVRQILMWLTSGPQAWDVEQQPEADGSPADLPLDEASVQAAQSQDDAEPAKPSPAPPATVVPWDQLNEDDKQDALLPKLAARGLDLHEATVADDAAKTTGAPVLAATAADLDIATQVESDVQYEPQDELHGALHDAAVAQDAGQQYELQQAQHYRHLAAQRFPLMYHVLQLRRSQQDALQQEQRATAYLRLLDLHLLQHEQEAEARRRQRQHEQDLLRVQQDEARWAQQGQWVQQEQQGPVYYTLRRPTRHLHGRPHRHRHHHRRHQHAF